jgi:hypothetical protein
MISTGSFRLLRLSALRKGSMGVNSWQQLGWSGELLSAAAACANAQGAMIAAIVAITTT